MYGENRIALERLALRLAELIPEYLPGVDTGAFEASDRRRCWNKTLKYCFEALAEEMGMHQRAGEQALPAPVDQLAIEWQKDGVLALTLLTGWGDRESMDRSLAWLLAVKSPTKVLVYSCARWSEEVNEQIRGALHQYPYHVAGESYLLLNVVGAQRRLSAMRLDVRDTGRIVDWAVTALVPVPGSPFSWQR